MRRPFIAGNWKMNTDSQSGPDLVKALGAGLAEVDMGKVVVAVIPPFVYLSQVVTAARASRIAVGAQDSLKLNVPGEDAKGILQALPFLKDVNTGKKPAVGKKVVVIGGGSVAMDVATSALRLGAGSVQVVCLECSNEEMPALEEEILQAERGQASLPLRTDTLHYLHASLCNDEQSYSAVAFLDDDPASWERLASQRLRQPIEFLRAKLRENGDPSQRIAIGHDATSCRSRSEARGSGDCHAQLPP